MVNGIKMEKKIPAYKGWGNCMDSFISDEGDSSLLSNYPQFTPDSKIEISWSSSSEDECASMKSKKKKVVTRLNFDECVSRSSGQVTPLYSRHLSDVDSIEKNKTDSKCHNDDDKDCLATPTKEISLQPVDVDLPSSPVIMRRKRRRSFDDKDVSPVIKRSFKKIRNIATEQINSPDSVISNPDLDKSLSDLITPAKLNDDIKQATNITPALEGLNLRSLMIQGKGLFGTEEKAAKRMNPSSPSPVIEIASSQDIQMDNAITDDSEKIKESLSESQNEGSNCVNSSQGIPLSAVITASASPTLTPSALNESEMSVSYDWETSFSMLPNMMETPVKNSSLPMEDPESGRKRKRLKKGGLAIRLQRLLNREQSWKRMWKHERLGKTGTSDEASVTLLVLSIWSEATKVLVQCKVEPKQKPPVQILSDSVILLLDPITVGERGIRAGCVLRLHPPWQTLMLNNNQLAVLLCGNLLEVVQTGEHHVVPKKEKVIVKEYNCNCIEGRQKECSFRFEHGGLEFLSRLMPSLGAGMIGLEKESETSEPMLMSTQMPPGCESSTNTGSERRKEGTVSWIVADRSQRGGCVGSTYLIARVQRVFCYRNPQQSSSVAKKGISSVRNYDMLWSALLQDSSGEFCEVEFNRQRSGLSQEIANIPDSQTMYWGNTDVVSALQEGAILRLNGLKILRRSDGNKTRGLPVVMNGVRMETKARMDESRMSSDLGRTVNGQSFVYTFASEEEGSLEKMDEDMPFPSCSSPLVQTLFDAFHGWEAKDSIPRVIDGQRVTVIVKLLFSLPSGDGKVPLKLFVTDPSLSALNSREHKSVLWVPFIIKLSCCPPAELTQWLSCSSLSTPIPVMCLQDVEQFGGELIGDRYSRIFLANEKSVGIPSWMSAHSDILSFTRHSLLPRVATVKPTSMPGEVVSITGNVIGVDEETAFSWPACNMCGNDHLSEVNTAGSSNQQAAYHCGRCQSLVKTPFTKMSLDAFLACSSLPPERCRIKVKLYQKSIMELLPPNKEQLGYELASVLGKLIGPLYCLLVSSHKNFQRGQAADLVFTAEELKCFVNMPL